MVTDEEGTLQETNETNASSPANTINSKPSVETTEETSADISAFYNEQVLSAEQNDEEITNNDGSVKETLDTAFHSEPGYIKDHSLAGSNRADYYEARSQGKSDVDEELDYLRNQKNEEKAN